MLELQEQVTIKWVHYLTEFRLGVLMKKTTKALFPFSCSGMDYCLAVVPSVVMSYRRITAANRISGFFINTAVVSLWQMVESFCRAQVCSYYMAALSVVHNFDFFSATVAMLADSATILFDRHINICVGVKKNIDIQ